MTGRNVFKASETADIDMLLLPMVQNEPRLFTQRLLSDTSKLEIFGKIFEKIAQQLFDRQPALRGRVDTHVLQQRWKNIKDIVNKILKKEQYERSEYQKKQLNQTAFCHKYLSNYNTGREGHSTAVVEEPSPEEQSTQQEVIQDDHPVQVGPSNDPAVEEPPALMDPPEEWMPKVQDAARRRLEWETAKRIKLSQQKPALLEVDEDQRAIGREW